MTALLEAPAPETDAPARRSRIPLWALLVALAAAVAAVSLPGALPGATGLLIAVPLSLVALTLAVAAIVATPERVLGPLALCLALLVNPGTVAVAQEYTPRLVGHVTIEEGGLVFWRHYPAVAGADPAAALAAPRSGDVARDGSDMLREMVTAVSEEAGLKWGPALGDSAVHRMPNGYGGESLLNEVELHGWRTTEFPEDPATRAALRDLMIAIAAEHGLVPAGDAGIAEGEIILGDGGVRLARIIMNGEELTFSFSARLLLAEGSERDFERRIARFDGLIPPAPAD